MSFLGFQQIRRIKRFFILCFVLFVFMFSVPLMALTSDADSIVVEHLRLHVPSKSRQAWLEAEHKSWGPWLAKQFGFLSRELFWDSESEEATLLIRWTNRDAWKAIPQEEIEHIQELFEEISRDTTGQSTGNPFPLVFEGELQPQ